VERLRQKIKWDERSELVKTIFLLVIVVGGTLGGYGIFMVVMGTTTPLVVVTSGSMVPTLQRGDLLVLQGRAEENIAVGDIIVFTAPGHDAPIVHRVNSIEEVDGEIRYYTKGENNNYIDSGYRTYNDIIGVYVLKIPYLGHVSLFLKQPIGTAIALILIVVILIVPEFVCKDEEEEEVVEGKEESPETSSE
jgi:signal peptidase